MEGRIKLKKIFNKYFPMKDDDIFDADPIEVYKLVEAIRKDIEEAGYRPIGINDNNSGYESYYYGSTDEPVWLQREEKLSIGFVHHQAACSFNYEECKLEGDAERQYWKFKRRVRRSFFYKPIKK